MVFQSSKGVRLQFLEGKTQYIFFFFLHGLHYRRCTTEANNVLGKKGFCTQNSSKSLLKTWLAELISFFFFYVVCKVALFQYFCFVIFLEKIFAKRVPLTTLWSYTRSHADLIKFIQSAMCHSVIFTCLWMYDGKLCSDHY